jgi:hypothetical protein
MDTFITIGQKKNSPPRVKYWEIIADNLSHTSRELALRLSD